MKRKTAVLVVDDDAEIRKILSEVLKTEGYVVKAVETGKNAIAESKKQFFDVALIDV